jgi:hypothetical protein
MQEYELIAYCITFARLEHGKEWDWDSMKFIERR